MESVYGVPMCVDVYMCVGIGVCVCVCESLLSSYLG